MQTDIESGIGPGNHTVKDIFALDYSVQPVPQSLLRVAEILGLRTPAPWIESTRKPSQRHDNSSHTHKRDADL